MLSRWASPFETFDYQNPLLSYVIREVRGGRTPQGLVRYTWQVAAVVGALMLAGAVLTPLLFWAPVSFRGEYWFIQVFVGYSIVVALISIFLFPIIDLVTLFYGAISIRTEVARDVRFDLVRASTLNPQDYVQSRLALAQVRAWRVFIVMWIMRFFGCLLLAISGLVALALLIFESGVFIDDVLRPEVLYGVSFVVAGIAIFLPLMLLEPLWRFRMMTALAAALAARIRGGFTMWLALGGSTLLVLFLQGMFAVTVVWVGSLMSSFVNEMWFSYDSNYQFRDMASTTVGLIPWMAMPPGVWALQMSVTRWWEDTAAGSIFTPRARDR